MRRAKLQRLLGLAGRVAILSNDEIEAMDEGEYRGWHEVSTAGPGGTVNDPGARRHERVGGVLPRSGADVRARRRPDRVRAGAAGAGRSSLNCARGSAGVRRQRCWAVPALPQVPVDGLDFTSAGDLLRDLREQGRAIPSIDGLIATLAVRHDVALLTLDGHFAVIPGSRLAQAIADMMTQAAWACDADLGRTAGAHAAAAHMVRRPSVRAHERHLPAPDARLCGPRRADRAPWIAASERCHGWRKGVRVGTVLERRAPASGVRVRRGEQRREPAKYGIDFHEAQAFVVGRQPDAASRSLPR